MTPGLATSPLQVNMWEISDRRGAGLIGCNNS